MLDPESTTPDCYQKELWYQDYKNDAAKIFFDSQWEPYTYWRAKKMVSPHINVLSSGARLSWKPEKTDNELNIYMFGGSTAWGWGARDEHTIPSYLAKELNLNASVSTNITNFGQLGYVNSQEVISLIRRLGNNNIPDAVIFYDGLNDVFSSYQSGTDGLPQNELNRKNQKAARYKLLSRSALYSKLTQRKKDNGICLPQYELSDTATKELFENIARRYFQNIRMINALGREFGFSTFCFWQPTLFTKLHRTTYEENLFESHKFWYEFYKGVQHAIEKYPDKPPFFSNLSNIFDDKKATIYIDPLHVSEEGNKIISQKIQKIIKQENKFNGNRVNTNIEAEHCGIPNTE